MPPRRGEPSWTYYTSRDLEHASTVRDTGSSREAVPPAAVAEITATSSRIQQSCRRENRRACWRRNRDRSDTKPATPLSLTGQLSCRAIPAVVPVLVTALGDAKAEVRAAAAEALGRIGPAAI